MVLRARPPVKKITRRCYHLRNDLPYELARCQCVPYKNEIDVIYYLPGFILNTPSFYVTVIFWTFNELRERGNVGNYIIRLKVRYQRHKAHAVLLTLAL